MLRNIKINQDNKKRKIKRKIKYTSIVLSILFCMLFSGITPLVNWGEFEEKPTPIWYNPSLADFLYEDVPKTSNPFNAYNESYIICKVQNTAYASFTFNNSQYNATYGMNYYAVDFGEQNQSYSIDISQSDISNDVFDWICVQPLGIAEDFIEVNLTTPETVYFKAGGSISLLVLPDFLYNDLYIEIDDIVINNNNYTTEDNVDSAILISSLFNGVFIQYDLFLKPETHQINFKGNGTLEYIIISSYDWDNDLISDVEEVQNGFAGMDPTCPMVWGYFEQGSELMIPTYNINSTSAFNITALYRFYIPDRYKGDNYVNIILYYGEIFDIRIDGEFNMIKESIVDEGDYVKAIPVGKLDTGFHDIEYEVKINRVTNVGFFIDEREMYQLSLPNLADSDGDGLKDVQEDRSGCNSFDIDTDDDGLDDGFDGSPNSYLILDKDKIHEFVIPHNKSRNTIIDFSFKRPEGDSDYYTEDVMKWEDKQVVIMPVIRLFGNSSISMSELNNIWGKDNESFSVNGIYPDGDNIIGSHEENDDVSILLGSVSNETITFSLKYNIGHSAKDDDVIDMRFDLIWAVMGITDNKTEIFHFYDFDNDIILQSMVRREVQNTTYILASPDSMIEKEILWNLVQNENLGNFEDFGVDDDIVGNGNIDYSTLIDQLKEDRENNPISRDDNGNINETEALFFSLEFSNLDLLHEITYDSVDNMGISKYYGNFDTFISYCSNSENPTEDLESLFSDMKNYMPRISYLKAWDDYGDSEYEKRFSIQKFPITMNRIQNFEDAEILEIVYATGKDIPLDKLPHSLETVSHDKINYINNTLIEKDITDENVIPDLSFDQENDIEKSINDNRLLEIPFSDLIFNSYSEPVSHILKGLSDWQYLDDIDKAFVLGLVPKDLTNPNVKLRFRFMSGNWYRYETALRNIRPPIRLIIDPDLDFIDEALHNWDPDMLPDMWAQVRRDLQRVFHNNPAYSNRFGIRWNPFSREESRDNMQYWRTVNENDRLLGRGVYQRDDLVDMYGNTYATWQEVWDDCFNPNLPTCRRIWNLKAIRFKLMSTNFIGIDAMKEQLVTLIDHFKEQIAEQGELSPLGQHYYDECRALLSRYDRMTSENVLKIQKRCLEIAEAELAWNVKIGTMGIDYRHANFKEWRHFGGLKNFIAGGCSVALGGFMIFLGVMNIIDAFKNPKSPPEFIFRLYGGIGRIAMGMTMVIMGISMFKECVSAYKCLYARSLTKTFSTYGPILNIIGIGIAIYDFIPEVLDLISQYSGETLTLKIILASVRFASIIIPQIISFIFMFSEGLGPVGVWVGIVGLIALIAWAIWDMIYNWINPRPTPVASVRINDKNTYYEVPEAKIKQHGSLEIGDEIKFYLNITNDGTQDAWMRANFSAGGSDWCTDVGKWDEETQGHYISDETANYTVTRTVQNAQSYLDMHLGMEIDIWDGDSRENVYNNINDFYVDIPILPTNISTFYNDLSESTKYDSYKDLVDNYDFLNKTYQYKDTNDTLSKLKNRVTYDFLNDSTGTMPTQWSKTKTNYGEFTQILRPNGDVLTQWFHPTSGYHYDNINEKAYYGDNLEYTPYIRAGDIDEEEYEEFEMTGGLSESVSCYEATLYICGGMSPTITGSTAKISFDGGDNWTNEKTIIYPAYPATIPDWIVLNWDINITSDLSDVHVKIYSGNMGYQALIDIHNIYMVVSYEKTDNSEQEIISSFEGHDNVLKVETFGESAECKIYDDFSLSRGSETIEFWLYKDNITEVEIDGLFQINKNGEILTPNGDFITLSNNFQWNHYKVSYVWHLPQCDIYLNGIKIINDLYAYLDDNYQFAFHMKTDYYWNDSNKYDTGVTYLDTIDYGWSSGYYDGRSFAYDYSPTNISYYEDLWDEGLIINTNIDSNLNENIVEMNTDTDIAEFNISLILDGDDKSTTCNFTFYNIPEGFSITQSEFSQSLDSNIIFNITANDSYQLAGVYYFDMNISIEDTIIYQEQIRFIIPVVDDLEVEKSDYTIFEVTDIDNGDTGDMGTPIQVSELDVVNVDFKCNSTNEIIMTFKNNGVETERYTLLSRGNIICGYQFEQTIIKNSFSFDQISFSGFEENDYLNITRISIIDATLQTNQQFNLVNFTNDGNIPKFISFDFMGIPFENVIQNPNEGEFFNETRIICIEPGDSKECDFNIILPTESVSNLLYRSIIYTETGTDKYYDIYVDNLEIEGIYIISPHNGSNIIYGKSISHGFNEFKLDTIAEDDLVWMGYSLDGASNVTFSEVDNITLSEIEGIHRIQVWGNNSVGTTFESEVRYFSIQYPIQIRSPSQEIQYQDDGILLSVISPEFDEYRYSLDDFDEIDFENNSTIDCSIGEHTIIIYGNNTSTEIYRSEKYSFSVLPVSTVPSQTDNFTFTKGSFDTYGDLSEIDNEYSIIDSSDIISEYIDDVDYLQGSHGSGSLSYTHTDDSNYYQIDSEYDYGTEGIAVNFVFDPTLSGRDFYLSLDIVTSGSVTGYLSINGETYTSGTTIDFNNVLITDVISISYGSWDYNSYNAKIYYFKLVETGNNATLNFQVDMEVAHPNCSLVYSLMYSHRTDLSIPVSLEIWNWITDSWYEIEDVSNSVNFDDDSFDLSYFVNSSFGVRVRFYAECIYSDFQLEIDRLRIDYAFAVDIFHEMPSQPDNFTFTYGSLQAGDLEYVDGDYSIIVHGGSLPADEFIDSITYSWATSGSGSIANTETDDSNYKQVNAKYLGNPVYSYWVEINLNFDPSLSGRDFYISAHIVTSGGNTGYLKINDQNWKTGSTIDFDNELQTGVTSIKFKTDLYGSSHNVKIYYLKIVEASDLPSVDIQVDMEVEDPDCDLITTLQYSYKTNVSATVDLDIWNWVTSSWFEIESVDNSATFDNDFFTLSIDSVYVNSTFGVRIRFQAIEQANNFQLEIDRLRLDYTTQT